MPGIPILMPQLGESIAEATIVQINVTPGEDIEADQEIFEVETNKATMGVSPPCSGRIAEIHVEIGETLAVGTTLAVLEVSAEEAARHQHAKPAPPPAQNPAAADIGSQQPGESTAHAPIAEQPRVEPTVRGLPVPASAAGAAYMSPRMRARMDELGLNTADLAGLPGSGAAGRVTVEDFEQFIADLDTKRTTAASSMRIAVADSMRRSWTRPLATVGTPVAIDKLLAHRRAADPKPGPAIYAVRALAIALAENTAAAGRLIGKQILHPTAIDIGFAVEAKDGVLVPVIRDVDQKPLRDLVDTYNQLVTLARQRRLPREATEPGVATVTNFGSFGIEWATPIPLPEQNLVLGLGAGCKRPNWDEPTQSWLPVTQAEITLSFDHRVIDGGAAGRLLSRIAELLQDPGSL